MNKEKEITKQPIPTKEECLAFYKELTKLADERFVPYYQMAIRALEQEPCNDAISRQAAIGCLNADFTIDGKENMETVVDYINGAFKQIKALPPVTPKPKTGHWVKVTNGRDGHECDLCHEYAPSYQSGDEYLTKYCPNCGRRIEYEG